jgi:multimeric flavodoxin WrbA
LWADRIIIGTPIYYSEPTGLVRSFIERVTFPAMSYSTYQSVFSGKVDVDVFLTMNAPMQFYNQNYERRFQEYFAPFRFLN